MSSMKRKIVKIHKTRRVIEQQYIQYPDLDQISFWVYLPNKRGTTKKFIPITTNPEKGLLLDRWHELKIGAFSINAFNLNETVFTIYGSKDIFAVSCDELKVYLILKGLAELQNFMTVGKNHVVQPFIKTDQVSTQKVLTT